MLGSKSGESGWVNVKNEWMVVAAVIFLIQLANVVTASRSPTIWMDEVMFTDPAANLIFGKGFTSTAWVKLSDDNIWAANAPLHSWLLIPWIKIVGFSPTAVRSINFLYLGLAAFLFWLAVRNSGIITSPLLRIGVVILIWFDSAIGYSYRAARYDELGILLTALAAVLITTRDSIQRRVCLICIGILVPFTGLQLLPFAVVVCLAFLVVYGVRSLRASVPLGLGVALGGALLYLVLTRLAAWNGFALAILAPRSDPTRTNTVAKLLAGVREYPAAVRIDPLFAAIIAILILGLVFNRKQQVNSWKRFDILALLLAFAIPIVLAMPGPFARYYFWMVVIPCGIAALQVLERFLKGNLQQRRIGWAIGLVLAITALTGLPARLAVTAIEWSKRDYSPVEAFISRAVKPEDVIVADWQAFYALAPKKVKVYYPIFRLNPEERTSVTELIISPDDFEQVTRTLGGNWQRVDLLAAAPAGLGAKLYNLAIYRRQVPN